MGEHPTHLSHALLLLGLQLWELLVLALYRRYQQEGEAFKPGYLRLLAHGGSARPEEILQEAGIDMRDPAFWQGGFDVIREMIDQLEQIQI